MVAKCSKIFIVFYNNWPINASIKRLLPCFTYVHWRGPVRSTVTRSRQLPGGNRIKLGFIWDVSTRFHLTYRICKSAYTSLTDLSIGAFDTYYAVYCEGQLPIWKDVRDIRFYCGYGNRVFNFIKIYWFLLDWGDMYG